MSESYRHDIILPKPKNLDKMIEYARLLSEGIPQVRVDFYDIDGKIYFGEMTFTSNQGRMPYYTQETLDEMGVKVKEQFDLYDKETTKQYYRTVTHSKHDVNRIVSFQCETT